MVKATVTRTELKWVQSQAVQLFPEPSLSMGYKLHADFTEALEHLGKSSQSWVKGSRPGARES